MNKNKGFTIIELILSFSITTIIVVLLFQLLLFLKDIYNDNGYKTELYIKQALISNEINNELETRTVTMIERDFDNCNNDNEFCIKFTFDDDNNGGPAVNVNNNTIKHKDFVTRLADDNHNSDVIIETDNKIIKHEDFVTRVVGLPWYINILVIDRENNTIQYGDFTTKLVTGSVIGDIKTESQMGNNQDGRLDSFVAIIIPIYHQLYEDEDFGIKIICQYNSVENINWLLQ